MNIILFVPLLLHSYSAAGMRHKAPEEQKTVLETRKRQLEEQGTLAAALNCVASMGNVANLQERLGCLSAALSIRQGALDMARQYCKPNDSMIFKLRNDLANHYSRQDTEVQHQVALDMRQSILEEQDAIPAKYEPHTLQTMALLASDLRGIGKIAEAIEVRENLLSRQKFVLGSKKPRNAEQHKRASTNSGSWEKTKSS